MARKIRDYACVEQDLPSNMLDVAKADPLGRLVGGTLKASLCDPNFSADASLYTFDKVFGVQRNLKNSITTVRVASIRWNLIGIHRMEIYVSNLMPLHDYGIIDRSFD